MMRGFVAPLCAFVVLAGCSGGLLGAPASSPVSWVDGAPGPDDARCPAFDVVAAAADGWWLSGPDCLLHATTDASRARLHVVRDGDWRIDRVDGVADAGDGAVWVAGRQRVDDAVRAVMGRLDASGAEVDSPRRWGLDGVLVNAVAAVPGDRAWVAGRRLGRRPGLLLARHDGEHWRALDTRAFGAGELLDADFTADGCGWFVGRDANGVGLLIRYDGATLHKEVLDRADGVPRRVAALSCSDLWLGSATVIRYAEGHREEIAFGPEAEVNGLAVCPDGDLLLVGERFAREPEMDGRRVGFAFRVRDGEATALPVQLPFAVDDWRLADVGCDERGAWAVGAAIARLTGDAPPERRALLLQLGDDRWHYKGWQYR